MKSKYLVVLLISVGVISAQQNDSDYKTDLANKINAKRLLADHPFIATIFESEYYGNDHICHGTILSPEWIVTTGCCVTSMRLGFIQVYVGRREIRDSDSDVSPRQVTAVLIHPEYSKEVDFYNIALIKLTEPLHFSLRVNKIELGSNEVEEKKSFLAVGFSPDKAAKNLYKLLEIDEMPYELCMMEIMRLSVRKFHNDDQQICAATHGRSTTLCWKDEGAPLVMYTEKKQLRLVGIFSKRFLLKDDEDKCEEGKPFVFTKVWKFLDWINNSTGLELTLDS